MLTCSCYLCRRFAATQFRLRVLPANSALCTADRKQPPSPCNMLTSRSGSMSYSKRTIKTRKPGRVFGAICRTSVPRLRLCHTKGDLRTQSYLSPPRLTLISTQRLLKRLQVNRKPRSPQCFLLAGKHSFGD